MAALNWFEGECYTAGCWRRAATLCMVAGKPILRRVGIAAVGTLIGLVAAGALGAVFLAFQLQAQPPQAPPNGSWVQHQAQKNENLLQDHERRLAQEERNSSAAFERLARNDRDHAKIDALNLGERLTSLENYVEIILYLLGLILASLVALLGKAFGRQVLGL